MWRQQRRALFAAERLLNIQMKKWSEHDEKKVFPFHKIYLSHSELAAAVVRTVLDVCSLLVNI